MKNLDLSLLRTMRTRWHTPLLEKIAMLLSKAGENAYIWFAIGVIGAIVDPDRRWQWVVAALTGPGAGAAGGTGPRGRLVEVRSDRHFQCPQFPPAKPLPLPLPAR